jgi:hypothetical protein
MMKGAKVATMITIALSVLGSCGVTPCRAFGGPKAVRLGSGALRNYHWRVNVYHGQTSRIPCIDIQLLNSAARSPIEGEIGETSCRATSPLPNALGLVNESDHAMVTVLAMGVPMNAREVTLVFHGSLRKRTMPLELLSGVKANKAKLRPFRYFTFAFRGHSCLSRFITHDARGHVLFDGGRMHCQA